MSLWLFVIVLLAVLDDLFRQLSPEAAVFYLLGLASCCIFLLFSFFYTDYPYIHRLSVYSRICVGVLQELRSSLAASRYRCGNCGQKIRGEKGVLPALRGNQRIGYLPVPAGGTPRSKGRYFGYRQLVLRVPTLGSPRTIVWYFTYQCLVAPVPTVGISCTKAGYYFGTHNRFILRGLQF